MAPPGGVGPPLPVSKTGARFRRRRLVPRQGVEPCVVGLEDRPALSGARGWSGYRESNSVILFGGQACYRNTSPGFGGLTGVTHLTGCDQLCVLRPSQRPLTKSSGTPAGTRTRGLPLRRRLLNPLSCGGWSRPWGVIPPSSCQGTTPYHVEPAGADGGARTHSLPFTRRAQTPVLLRRLVPAAGIGPATSSVSCLRSCQLS